MALCVEQKRLENNVYTQADAVEADLQKVWDNCNLYNGEHSEVAAMAKDMKDLTAQLIKGMQAEIKGDDTHAMKEMKKKVPG